MITLTRPGYMVLLTGLNGDYQQDKGPISNLIQGLQGEAGQVHWLWAIEPNPKGTGYHLHAWGWGASFTREQLAEQASRVGYGYTDLKPKTFDGGFAYIAKNAIHNDASLAEHIRLNGRELIHGRGFWRIAETGKSLKQREARKAALAHDQADAQPTPAQNNAEWSKRNLHALSPETASALRDEQPLDVIDVATGEIVFTRGRRAAVTALDGQGDVGAVIVTFRDSDGRMRMLYGIADGVRIVEYRSAA